MLFQSQINQYDSYTDRYLNFRVEFRKLIPYNKPTFSFLLNANKVEKAISDLHKVIMDLDSKILKHSETPDSVINITNLS